MKLTGRLNADTRLPARTEDWVADPPREFEGERRFKGENPGFEEQARYPGLRQRDGSIGSSVVELDQVYGGEQVLGPGSKVALEKEDKSTVTANPDRLKNPGRDEVHKGGDPDKPEERLWTRELDQHGRPFGPGSFEPVQGGVRLRHPLSPEQEEIDCA